MGVCDVTSVNSPGKNFPSRRRLDVGALHGERRSSGRSKGPLRLFWLSLASCRQQDARPRLPGPGAARARAAQSVSPFSSERSPAHPLRSCCLLPSPHLLPEPAKRRNKWRATGISCAALEGALIAETAKGRQSGLMQWQIYTARSLPSPQPWRGHAGCRQS